MSNDEVSRFDTGEILWDNTESKSAVDDQPLHPNALLVYWELYSRTKQWTSAHTIAEGLVLALPHQPIGWIYRSFALHRLGRVKPALAGLLEAAERFPDDWRIAYNAACYSCLLGDMALAWNWLDRAIELGNGDVIKSAALEDPNLRPLWARVGRV